MSWLSFYCWSTQNWNRPVAEQYCVLGLIRRFVREQLPTWQSAGIRFAWAGRRERISPHLRAELSRAEEATAANDGLTVCLCVGYGGRVELTNAVRKIARESAAGRLDPETTLDDHIRAHLYRPDMPDVDLLIRTSGEQRTSNFLTWQTTYAEMLFPPVLWPDFTPQDLSEAIHTYAERDRHFGALPRSGRPRLTIRTCTWGQRPVAGPSRRRKLARVVRNGDRTCSTRRSGHRTCATALSEP